MAKSQTQPTKGHNRAVTVRNHQQAQLPAAVSGGGGGGAPGGSAPATGTVGLPNTGSPTGKNTISPDIRIIERIMDTNHGGASHEHTEFPSDHVMENPAWWDYNGRWGARVAPSVAGSWESGWHRIDENRRGWSYWASRRLRHCIERREG